MRTLFTIFRIIGVVMFVVGVISTRYYPGTNATPTHEMLMGIGMMLIVEHTEAWW